MVSGYQIINPEQTVYVVTENLGFTNLTFFIERGCFVSKTIKPQFDRYGRQLTDFTTEDILKWAREKNYKIIDLDSKKEEKVVKSKKV
jgi:hypothetical protein